MIKMPKLIIIYNFKDRMISDVIISNLIKKNDCNSSKINLRINMKLRFCFSIQTKRIWLNKFALKTYWMDHWIQGSQIAFSNPRASDFRTALQMRMKWVSLIFHNTKSVEILAPYLLKTGPILLQAKVEHSHWRNIKQMLVESYQPYT